MLMPTPKCFVHKRFRRSFVTKPFESEQLLCRSVHGRAEKGIVRTDEHRLARRDHKNLWTSVQSLRNIWQYGHAWIQVTKWTGYKPTKNYKRKYTTWFPQCLWFSLCQKFSVYGLITVTRRKVAGMEVVLSVVLLFWFLNNTSNSCCRSESLPFFPAASKAFMVGP